MIREPEMTLNKGLMGGLALAAMASEGFMQRRPPSIAERGWRERVKNLLILHSAHTPKPEVMFAPMIDDGSAVLIRRRGKPPLLKRVTQQAKRRP